MEPSTELVQYTADGLPLYHRNVTYNLEGLCTDVFLLKNEQIRFLNRPTTSVFLT